MSMLEVLKNHKPVENPEFGQKKKLVGDAVAQAISLTKVVSKKNASEWLVLKCEAIHPIADPKGRTTTVEPGDEITKVYNASDAEALQDLDNDLFTAGIEYNKAVETEDAIVDSMNEAVKGKLLYFRTWAKDKNAEQMAKNPTPSFYQNIAIKSAKLITPENSVAMLPF